MRRFNVLLKVYENTFWYNNLSRLFLTLYDLIELLKKNTKQSTYGFNYRIKFCFGIISLTNLGWFGCTDHILNLTVNDVIRKSGEIKTMLATTRQIVLFTRNSRLASELLNKYQHALGEKIYNFFFFWIWRHFVGYCERQLILDVITRWNSTFYMVQRFVEEKVCITACLKEKIFQKHFSDYKISKSIEWDYLEELSVR